MTKPQPAPFDWGALAAGGPLSPEQIEAKAQDLLAHMTLDEKIQHMSGDTPYLTGGLEMLREYNTHPLPAGECPRLGIPGVRFSDGPRGVVMYNATCFPASMARGASWDVELEARIGDAIGVEARSLGANFFGGVCINLLRHPAWGRAQETYGEDPHHLGEMGAALVRGVQRHIMACAKHYALNSIENARFKVDVQAGERTLHEVYLPHFKRCVEEGVASIMSAYNQVNGQYCGHSAPLLRQVLKEQWGFQGFVVSDFVYGVRDGKAAALGGLDIEMPFTMHYGRKLKRLVLKGEVPQQVIDEAVLRILRQKLRFAQVGEPGRYTPDAVLSPAHLELAREAARKSMVLLKNDPLAETGRPLLPLDSEAVRRIALIGALAALPNTGDRGSSHVRAPYVVTPLEGLQAAVEAAQIVYEDGRDVESAARTASQAQVVILVVGYTHEDEGEYVQPVLFFPEKGGDRDTLTLKPHDEALIQAVAAANPRSVVVLVGGSAIITEAWRARVPAILMAWYSGMHGGHALADLLFGAANPGGKLPCAFPKSADQLPVFDKNAASIRYDRYHGYRLMERDGHQPAFPFGFGLSYTTYRYHDLQLEREALGPQDVLRASVAVTNTGPRPGDEIVQLYAGYPPSGLDRPHKELKAFAKLHLEAGETRRASFELSLQRLACYQPESRAWAVEPGRYTLYLGPSSTDADLLRAGFSVTLTESPAGQPCPP